MNASLLRISLAASVAAALLAGCGKPEKTEPPAPVQDAAPTAPAAAAPTTAPPPAPLGPDQSLTSEGATVSVGAAAAKVATPAYAPLFPDAVVLTSVIGESGVGPGGTVSYRTGSRPGEVIAFYRKRLAKVGKPITMSQDMGGDVHLLTAGDSGDGKGAVQVIASPFGKGAEVQLTWSDE